MDSPPPFRRQVSDDWSPPREMDSPLRSISNEFLETSNNRPPDPGPNFRRTSRRNDTSDEESEIQYGRGPLPPPRATRRTRRVRPPFRRSNASSRTRSPQDGSPIAARHTKDVYVFDEGIETDGRRAGELEEAGLSWTLTLPSDDEQSGLYTNLAEPNSVWKAEKICDRRIGTTTLQPIYSIQYSVGDKGMPKVTLFCPQGPARQEEDVSSVQARWLHVERPSMSIKVLEKLVMDCPLINRDIQRVAILLLEAVKDTFLRQAEHGAYVEPGSTMRFVGQRRQLQNSMAIVTDPVVFTAFPFVELDSSRNHSASGERDEYHPRTLLQNLYGFDVLTSRGKQQVIHKMGACRQADDILYVNQLWCLLIGSDILITMASRPTEKLLGDTIEKRTDFFKQPLRVEIVDTRGSRYHMSISLKTTWVDFFRHVMITIHGNLAKIMAYELMDEAKEVVTAERWVEIAKSTGSGLLRFHLVERRIPSSRASSVSSRRSSRTGIRKLLMLDQPQSRDSSRRPRASYDEDSSSSEGSIDTSKSSKPVRHSRSPPRPFFSDTPTFKQPVGENVRYDGKENEQYPHTTVAGHGSQSSPSIISIDISDDKESTSERKAFAMTHHRQLEEEVEGRNEFLEEGVPRDDPSPLPLQLPSPLDALEDDEDFNPLPTLNTQSSYRSQQLTEGNPEESQTADESANAVQLTGNSSHSDGKDDQGTLEESPRESIHPSPMKDSNSLDQKRNVQFVVDDPMEPNDRPASQITRPSSTYQQVTIEDEFEAESHDADNRAKDGPDRNSWSYEFIEADFDSDEVPIGKVQVSDQQWSRVHRSRPKTPHKGHSLGYREGMRRNSSYNGSRSRSPSPSSPIDDFFPPRGRSPVQRRRLRRRDDTHSSRESSSWRGVRFDSNSQHSKGRGSPEMSPYGSSNATKVEASTVTAAALPFFCWRQSGVASAVSSPEITDQRVIKLLDHVDELISEDPIGKYYSRIAEYTMDDVILRRECLHEAILEMDSVSEEVESGGFDRSARKDKNDPRSLDDLSRRHSDRQNPMTKNGNDESEDTRVKGPDVGVDNRPTPDIGANREHLTPNPGAARDSTNSTPRRSSPEDPRFNQTQALGLTSHDKALMKQLVGMSQQIIWFFIPNTGGSAIHTLVKRFWGCVDQICLQLAWEENQRGQDAERTYIIRNFSSQVKAYNPQQRKPSLGRTHYLECEDCKAAKSYSSAESALKHIHEEHIDCLDRDSGRPYDDPCYAWLHRIWHDGYLLRRSREGLLGDVEDFIEELSDISGYVRELLNMTARDSSTGDTPALSVNIIHIFQQIVKILVFRSKQLSLINRRQSLATGEQNTRLVQRIDRKIKELLLLEIDANERIVDLSESAKKDIFMSGIGSHSEMPQAETVRVQFLALAFMSGIQKPLLQSSYIGRTYAKDTLLQLYRDYTSRLHFQANNRPSKRVFLDIHGLEEELQALDKLLGSQESCLYNALTLIDPLTSRYTTESRLREFRAELQYGNDELRGIIYRRREIENLATRLRIIKDQVKQTIEIMEEDHGKAIRVFTVVTLFFLPLSFVSSFLGMNTVDVRDTEYSQRIFWMTGVPVTVAVLSVAFVYGYKGEEIRDWMFHALQDRRHTNPSLSENRDDGYRISLEAGRREWNPATATKQQTVHRRRLTALMRGRTGDSPDLPQNDIEKFQKDGSDGKAWIERRNTDDSLAPMRRQM